MKCPYIPYDPFPCVYKLKLGLGYFYIGSTINLNRRIDTHLSNIKTGRRDIEPYLSPLSTRHTVSVEILEEVKDYGLLIETEQFYIDKYIDSSRCVNISKKSGVTSKLKQIIENQISTYEI